MGDEPQGTLATVLTDDAAVEVWRDLTAPQRDALCVLADGRPHYCWKRSSDPTARAGKGCVNATSTSRLTRLRLARTVHWGDAFTGDTVEITEIGQAVWDASVWDAGNGSQEGQR